MDGASTLRAFIDSALGQKLAESVGSTIAKRSLSHHGAEIVGKGLNLAGRAAHSVYQHAGEVGAGLARGLGKGELGQTIGQIAGKTVAVGAGLKGLQHGKQRYEEYKYRRAMGGY